MVDYRRVCPGNIRHQEKVDIAIWVRHISCLSLEVIVDIVRAMSRTICIFESTRLGYKDTLRPVLYTLGIFKSKACRVQSGIDRLAESVYL